MTTVKRPARLDIVDMPRDTTRSLGGLRQALCASFNYCRKYPTKMTVLKTVLKYTYQRIVSWEKEELEYEASKYGIELDSRNNIDTMKADFTAKLSEQSKQTVTEGDK